MKIRAISLTNVRRFTDTVTVDGIGDGLNVLCEPNETGKSTLFDAIQAVFFKPHGSRDKEVMALRPHAGGAPEVSIEIETDAGRFTLTKRWLQKPVAEVHRAAQLIAQSDAAEAWIGDVLGLDGGGPSGLIWVRQGMTDFTEANPKAHKAALEARRDLMSTVGEEVDAMTGGRRMDEALARCCSELERYATGKNRTPRKGGPWKAAQDRVTTLTQEHETLRKTAHDLHDALAERSRARRELAELDNPEAIRERAVRLEAAEKAQAEAERHAEIVSGAARALDLARLTAESARNKLDQFHNARGEETQAREALDTAQAAVDKARLAQARAQARHADAETALQAAQVAFAAAQDTHTRSLRAQAARDGAERRAALQQQITQAVAARARMEQAEAEARTGPDARTLQTIEQMHAALTSARASRNAAATQVTMHYEADQAGSVRVGDSILSEGTPLPLHRPTRLTLVGLGTLTIQPPQSDQSDGAVEHAEGALAKALATLGLPSVEAARSAAIRRRAAEQEQGEARAVMASLAPDGIDHLRAALAALPALEDLSETPTLDVAQAALAAATSALDEARRQRDAAAAHLSETNSDLSREEAGLGAQTDRLTRARETLARLGDVTLETLTNQLEQAETALQEATRHHADTAARAPDHEATAAALARARSVDARAREEIDRLRPLLARLDERIRQASGDAVEERLAETAESLAMARADLARLGHEVAVLTRLEQALEAARSEARERYFTPVANELRPLLHLLWPDAQLTWAEDTLLPEPLVRNQTPESVDLLSGGTQEQIALLVRLAFARMLAKAGRVAPVILDDALVFTDDDRIERMFDALHRQAGNLQIIVLTCRQRAFRGLGGHVLRLKAAP